MALTLLTKTQSAIAAKDDARLYRAIFNNQDVYFGVTGDLFTVEQTRLVIKPSCFVVCGRIVKIDADYSLNISTTTGNYYINLEISPNNATPVRFVQATSLSLTSTDINANEDGTYRTHFAKVVVSNGAIVTTQRMIKRYDEIQSSGSITVDEELDEESTNPVQNKAVATTLNQLINVTDDLVKLTFKSLKITQQQYQQFINSSQLIGATNYNLYRYFIPTESADPNLIVGRLYEIVRHEEAGSYTYTIEDRTPEGAKYDIDLTPSADKVTISKTDLGAGVSTSVAVAHAEHTHTVDEIADFDGYMQTLAATYLAPLENNGLFVTKTEAEMRDIHRNIDIAGNPETCIYNVLYLGEDTADNAFKKYSVYTDEGDDTMSGRTPNWVEVANLQSIAATKVDKVAGKGLSTNDFTNELKTKLENAAEAGHTHSVADITDLPQVVTYIEGEGDSEGEWSNEGTQDTFIATTDYADIKDYELTLDVASKRFCTHDNPDQLVAKFNETATGLFNVIALIAEKKSLYLQYRQFICTSKTSSNFQFGHLYEISHNEETGEYTIGEIHPELSLAETASGGEGASITVDDALSNTSTNPVQNKAIYTELGKKVDKVSGKGLSTNDYTTDERNKLSGIESGANKTVVDTSLSGTSNNPVANSVIKAEFDSVNTALGGKADIGHTHSEFSPTSHTHTAYTPDTALSSTSTKPIQNKVVTNALGDKADKVHEHTIANVTGLTEALQSIQSTEGNDDVFIFTAELDNINYVGNNVSHTFAEVKAQIDLGKEVLLKAIPPITILATEVYRLRTYSDSVITFFYQQDTRGCKVTYNSNSEMTWNTELNDSALSATSNNAVQNRTITNALNNKADISHTHTAADITDLPTTPNITIDSALSTTSENPVQNKVINTALAGKANSSHSHTLDEVSETTSKKIMTATERTKLSGIAEGANKTVVDNSMSSTSTNPVQNKVVNTALSNKVDKESGKGLSTNDYTTAEKTKLSGIAEGANKTTVDTALSTTSTNPVQNKIVKAALDSKSDSSHTHSNYATSDHTHSGYATTTALNNMLSKSGGTMTGALEMDTNKNIELKCGAKAYYYALHADSSGILYLHKMSSSNAVLDTVLKMYSTGVVEFHGVNVNELQSRVTALETQLAGLETLLGNLL